LSRLQLAVNDRIAGAKPTLFFDRPERKGTRGAPSHTSAIVLRALVVAAFLALRAGGWSEEEAGDLLEAELKRSGIKQSSGRAISARAIVRWREELGGKSVKGSDQVFGMLVHGMQFKMQEMGQQLAHSDTPVDRPRARAVSQFLVKCMRIAG